MSSAVRRSVMREQQSVITHITRRSVSQPSEHVSNNILQIISIVFSQLLHVLVKNFIYLKHAATRLINVSMARTVLKRFLIWTHASLTLILVSNITHQHVHISLLSASPTTITTLISASNNLQAVSMMKIMKILMKNVHVPVKSTNVLKLKTEKHVQRCLTHALLKKILMMMIMNVLMM